VSGFVLYDDGLARGFAPFALTRPAGELRAGAALIRERWVRALGVAASGFIGAPHLREFVEFEAPRAAEGRIPAESWVVNARCAPALAPLALAPEVRTILCDGIVAAVRLDRALDVAQLADGTLTLEALATGGSTSVAGWWLRAAWDLVGHLPAMLLADTQALLPATPDAKGMTIVGAHAAHAEAGAHIEPMVIADTTAGPVLVRTGAHIQAFTRLVGPCVIGEESTVMGGRIASCSIGPKVKVCGEMSVTIMIGHANKGHDGFVGHSVIGRWANFGAGTITSNLKNSYGEVTMWADGEQRRTGLQFLGSLVGDHAKTGIGTRLSTGSVLGAGSNVFGTRMPPKVVLPFAWGDGEPWETFDLARFLLVAGRVMGRRGVTLGPEAAAHWATIFARRDQP
jgi:UDP-N-acetylglucosamine diphosphorylase / glucose-1-phosphate thymidylyltransferase / UDP-N-acetylgalactosamine diphosphorylase / glucosamine-1-phosphate N-acetyltransferase / galactosamine-1-phosphate N-acetyltransferase